MFLKMLNLYFVWKVVLEPWWEILDLSLSAVIVQWDTRVTVARRTPMTVRRISATMAPHVWMRLVAILVLAVLDIQVGNTELSYLFTLFLFS